MPIQAPSWTEFLSCPICCNEFAANQRLPISLGCGHTICRLCLGTLHNRLCPFDQTLITTDVDNLPINYALLQLVSNSNEVSWDSDAIGQTAATNNLSIDDLKCYKLAKKCIENLALHLKSFLPNGNFGSLLSKPMQRKLVTLVNCQLMEEEGRLRSLRTARALGERTVTELILQHQNPQQLSSNLWAAVRSRGCQFLGPAMQEEVLKLVLLALEDGSARSRKVLVMFVVQRLEPHFPQASKTSIGHVVQLLYRASCFKVSKREADSSLMQLKEEFRTYEALRREHDAQIVQIATEAGLRIAPDQWSSLLYGDTIHKSHMQSINDKLQTPSSFAQSVQELVIALQRTGDPANLSGLRSHLKHLAGIDPTIESMSPSWDDVAKALDAVRQVIIGMVEFVQHHGNRKLQECVAVQSNHNAKYKISLCRDLTVRRICPRGTSCTFAHSEEELEKFRSKNRKNAKSAAGTSIQNACSTSKNEFSPHHNHLTDMMYMGEETVAASSSSMQFLSSNHGKNVRGSFGDGPLALHMHSHPSTSSGRNTHPIHQSPIPQTTNGILLTGANGVPISAHQFEASFGNMNFNAPHFPPIGIPACNPNADGMAARNFSNTLQHRPMPINLTNSNPPNFPNSNTTDLSNSLQGAASYSDIYGLGVLGTTKTMPFYESAKSTNNGNNNNGIYSNQFSMPQTCTNIRPSTNLLWDQNQNRQQVIDKISSVNVRGVSKSTLFLSENPNPLNGQGDGLLTNKLRVNNSLLHGPSNTIIKKNMFSDDRQHSSFWNANNENLGGKAQKSLQAVHSARNETSALSLRDRDFVRSDSILEDDGATFDVPNSSALLGGKYGPICPMYKGQNTTTVGDKVYSTWSSMNDQALTDERTILECAPAFSVFSDSNENTLAMHLQQPITSFEQFGSMQSARSKLSGMRFNNGLPPAKNVEDKTELDLGLNTLKMMVSSSSEDDNEINQSSVGDALLWNNPIRTVNRSHFWNDAAIASGMTKSMVDKHQHQQLPKSSKISEENIDGVIDSCRMRDIEMELTDIVDKDSSADDSGIKLD